MKEKESLIYSVSALDRFSEEIMDRYIYSKKRREKNKILVKNKIENITYKKPVSEV